MTFVRRLLLGLLFAVAAFRACAYLFYAATELRNPLEAGYLEAKMVLLAYRAQIGVSLYPRWHDYPHVTNFFGPVYFGLVGLLGAALGADIPALFSIGRAVTFISALSTTGIVGWVVARRHGRAAGLTAVLLIVGVYPMNGCSVMVRPDALAELLGLSGFFLTARRARGAQFLGGVLLVLAVLTKQTSALYLAAAVLALAFEGQRVRACWLLAACSVALGAVVLGVTVFVEPNFAASLAGESQTPWTSHTMVSNLVEIIRCSPDLLLLPAIGLYLWLATAPRDVRPATLAIVLFVGSVLAAGKLGAAANYYLGLRAVEGLAAGAFWQAAGEAKGRARWVVLTTGAAVLVTLALGAGGEAVAALRAGRTAGFIASPAGRSYLRVHEAVYEKARDPKARLLTDSGMVDLHQGTRAAFGDPWLFRVMVETGRIDPVLMKERIETQYYDMVVTETDLTLPKYAHYDHRMPMVLAERVRAHYEPLGSLGGLFFYVRRGKMPRAAPAPADGLPRTGIPQPAR